MNIEINRKKINELRFVHDDKNSLAEGQARISNKLFSLTANNITYAAMGDTLGYWKFFPTGNKEWGNLPVWGLADVTESKSEHLKTGQQVYGYIAMGKNLSILPRKPNQGQFMDDSSHRQFAAKVYNGYVLTEQTEFFSRAGNMNMKILYWPLFGTSFLIDDFLEDKSFFDAQTVVLSSASSKTALAAAYMISRRKGMKVIGLTSGGRVEFLHSLGCYDKVYSYDNLTSITKAPTVYIDFSGNDRVNQKVHDLLGDELKYSMIVGATHWNKTVRLKIKIRTAMMFLLPYNFVKLFFKKPVPEFFFAPTQQAKRLAELGKEGYNKKFLKSWDLFSAWSEGWIEFRQIKGEEKIKEAYLELLNGQSETKVAYICSFE